MQADDARTSSPTALPQGPVCSYTEWDPLEEVIVGDPRGAMHPSWNVINRETVPEFAERARRAIDDDAGRPFGAAQVEAALEELEGFVAILEQAGVTVRRPESVDHAAPYATPAWTVANGYCAANPRDVFLVVGDEIIETPMADRGRYFESWAYRPLLKEYFAAGARWTAAPKPRLLDSQFDLAYEPAGEGQATRYVVTEDEPVFDAADFVRCGRDLFGQLSHATNRSGVEWLRRHLGDGFSVHLIESRCRQPLHIDTTFMPLAPGKVLVNPEFVDVERLPAVLAGWDILVAPEPAAALAADGAVVSDWMSMNVLMLDDTRVVVEEKQLPLIRALKDWGFEPVPCAFESYYAFAGSFHCATLDVRRRGELTSYF
jgi:glycine amidinotransferase